MASSSSSSSSCSPPPPRINRYHVYLSFRGADTRDNFTSHLYSALSGQNIQIFIDDQLNRGDEISESLVNAIEASGISVIIFSKGYASSRWCLDELVKILECNKEYAQIVIPVYYRVDPSDVRNQTGTFGDSFSKLEERFKENFEKLQTWRNALRPESKLVKAIVNEVLERLDGTFRTQNNNLVGVESCIKEIYSLLVIGSTNVSCKLGIWGIGGIGKTTIAGAVFNKISRHFEGSYFLHNVREAEETGRLVDVRQQVISTLLNDENVKNFPYIGLNFQSKRLAGKKFLIVFDVVSHPRQIEFLIGNLDWFAPGSQIIITTRDIQVLIECRVDQIYRMKELVHADAFKLFSQCAFGGDHPYACFIELTHKLTMKAGGRSSRQKKELHSGQNPSLR